MWVSKMWFEDSAFWACFSAACLLVLRRSIRFKSSSFSCTSSLAIWCRRSASLLRAMSAWNRTRTSRSTSFSSSCTCSLACRSWAASSLAAAASWRRPATLEMPSGSALGSNPGMRSRSKSSFSHSSLASLARRVEASSLSTSASFSVAWLDFLPTSRSRKASASCCCAPSRSSCSRASSSLRSANWPSRSARSAANVFVFSRRRSWALAICRRAASSASRALSATRLCSAMSACSVSTCNALLRCMADFSRRSLLICASASVSLARAPSEKRSTPCFSTWLWASAAWIGNNFDSAMFFSWRHLNLSVFSLDSSLLWCWSWSESFSMRAFSASRSRRSSSHRCWTAASSL
mmetsp:Transcript_76294/g.223661  ORF Transcript_76294/g.223661 Transcript_76294/m.223661 type:complete len:350 (-) Transcript_76294:361-1410(-)